MRHPTEWTEHDLAQLVANQVAESLTLDYKASGALQKTDAKKNELSKDVSAFANSAGGLLVYGIQEVKHQPTQVDYGLDPSEISKEWIEQVINSKISRRVDGVRIFQIPLSGERLGRVAYVVEVPASAAAPHMASDHRFYKRFNFECVPMEEYEVRDVSRRFTAPNLGLNVVPLEHTTRHRELPSFEKLSIYIENTSPAAADYALIAFHLSAGAFEDVRGSVRASQIAFTLSGSLVPVYSYKVEWRGTLRLPLMQGARYHITDLTVMASETPAHVFWEVLAPNSDSKRGCVMVQGRSDGVRVAPVNEVWHEVDQILWRI